VADQIVNDALKHLLACRDELQKEIAANREQIKNDTRDLAKVEQAFAGLRPLGSKSLLEKAGPILAVAGTVSLALLLGMASTQGRGTLQFPSTSDLIVGVLREGGQSKDSEILARLTDLGWESTSKEPLGLIRSYLSRLIKQGEVLRVGQSTYGLPIATYEEVEADGEVSTGGVARPERPGSRHQIPTHP
jgi:hypothetical protein